MADGDLHVAGDLILLKEQAFLLAVNGSLQVDGLYRDYDGPESYLLVSGDMRARDIITTGYLTADAVLDMEQVDIAVPPPLMDLDDPRVSGYIDPELLLDDEDDAMSIDYDAIRERVAAGIPLRTTAASA